jgi:hypothetical protein
MNPVDAHARKVKRATLPALALALHHFALDITLGPHATTTSLRVFAQTSCEEVGDVIVTCCSRLPTLVAVGCGTCRRFHIGFGTLWYRGLVIEIVSAALTRQRGARCRGDARVERLARAGRLFNAFTTIALPGVALSLSGIVVLRCFLLF